MMTIVKEQESLKDLMARYTQACNYPGEISPATVNANLEAYLRALNVNRKVVQLPLGWSINKFPELQKYVRDFLAEFSKRQSVWAAIDAIDAMAARAAIDAMDEEATQRLMRWCMQSSAWRWYSFEMSWIATTHLGAIEHDDTNLQRWTAPFFEAFTAGAWFLFWTGETLYWVAKPQVHVEQTPTGRRLHCSDGPAIKSDCEDLYFWHGVMIPSFIVTNPEQITVQIVDAERNAEVRRVMLERFPGGLAAYLVGAGAKVVHRGNSRHKVKGLRGSRLLYREIPEDEPIVMIECRNSTPEPDGTTKLYHIRVDPNAYGGMASRDVHAAMASTWRKADGSLEFKDYREYLPAVET